MGQGMVLELARGAIMTGILLAGPLLVAALGVGLMVSILQAVTQVQEQTLAFAAKLAAVGGLFFLLLPWMLQVAVRYATEILRAIPEFAG